MVEVYGQRRAGPAQLRRNTRRCGRWPARVEVSGETVFFYTQDSAGSVLQALASRCTQLRTLHRPANLEDLFLKLTGRQIRDDS